MVLLGGGYHVVLWAIGRVAFPSQAEGSLIRRDDGTIVGSRLIAQKFTQTRVLPLAPVGCRLQRRVDRRHELRAVESRSPEGGAGATRGGHDTGRGHATAGSVGDGDSQRRRSRSAYPARRGRPAGEPRRVGPRRPAAARARARTGAHRVAHLRIPRARAGQRARAEPGARCVARQPASTAIDDTDGR